jgi:hypothetical protein
MGVELDPTPRAYEANYDVAPPMYDSSYYAISGYVVADTTKTKFLFLFLPRTEKIRDANTNMIRINVIQRGFRPNLSRRSRQKVDELSR